MSLHPTLDFVVVNPSTTPGWQVSSRSLCEALESLGYSVCELVTPPRRLRRAAGRLGYVSPVMDLVEATAVRLTMRRAVQSGLAFSNVIYMSSTAAMLEPRSRLKVGILRVDTLARQSRPGAANAVLRWLERRSLRAIRFMWSMNAGVDTDGEKAPPTFVLPPLVRSSAPVAAERERVVLAYANGPKKRLDLMLRAWADSMLADHGWRLVVAGCTPEGARAMVGSDVEPPGVAYAGLLATPDFRALTRRATIFLAAPEYEDFGIAPLEAIADGCILVTTRSPGPYAALRLAERETPTLVADPGDAPALGRALARAANLDTPELAAVRTALTVAVSALGQDEFERNLGKALHSLAAP